MSIFDIKFFKLILEHISLIVKPWVVFVGLCAYDYARPRRSGEDSTKLYDWAAV